MKAYIRTNKTRKLHDTYDNFHTLLDSLGGIIFLFFTLNLITCAATSSTLLPLPLDFLHTSQIDLYMQREILKVIKIQRLELRKIDDA